MREIKFRAWDTKRNTWLKDGNYDSLMMDMGGGLYRVQSDSCETPARDLDNYILSQFIGISIPLGLSTEKVDIYSGDIIAIYKDDKEYFRGVVTDHGHVGYTIDSESDYMEFMMKGYTYKKLGDKFSNPELLK